MNNRQAASQELQEYDIWRTYANGRAAWAATPHREDDSLKPVNAYAHWDTVWAHSKREAIRNRVK